jgi:hypothetical protein
MNLPTRAWLWSAAWIWPAAAIAQVAAVEYEIELTSPTKLFTAERCWAHPRAGAIPPGVAQNPGPSPIVVMTLQPILLAGSDLFYELHDMRTDDLGRTWTAPRPLDLFKRQPVGPDRELTVCDFTPRWHAASGRLLGTGHTALYEKNRVATIRPRHTAYAVYDAPTRAWSAWKTLEMPDDPRFANAGAGSTQRLDLPDGRILLPIYFKPLDAKQYASTIVRCAFDGSSLRYLEHGDELTVPIDRGLYEPSLTRFQGRFYLTLRNDRAGYVALSDDGLRFSTPRPWTWDDGADLGNYNTQQHWVTHTDGLFLVYTRRGADNDHIMRHRAPLFIAQVDPGSLRVIRSTEKILMPQRGARLGNFAVVEVSDQETWVTDAEWMQPAGCEKLGSDGSVWVSKIRWKKPNTHR